MKLIILLSIAALVSCEYPAAQPEAPADSYGAPTQNPEPAEETSSPSSAPVDLPRSLLTFTSFQGAFPPSTFPPVNFLSTYPYRYSLRYPLTTFSYPSTFSAQGIFPPQFSQIISPPFFGNPKPALPTKPVTPSVAPPQALPQVVPQTFAKLPQLFSSQIPKLSFSYPLTYFSPYSYFNTPFAFSFPSSSLFSAPTPAPAQKEPAKTQEPLSTSYGPPAPTPAETSAPFEPSGPAETSAPFEPSPVSYPYEPAAPDTPEPAPAPYKPAQEYGVPS